MDNSFSKSFLNSLLRGDGSVIHEGNIRLINEIALELYNKSKLTQTDIEDLKAIIMACNIIYNRTDLTIMVIEDGFYDLLLEKYKLYDSNFQVGSAIVDLKNLIINDVDNPIPIAKQPLIFIEQPKRNELMKEIHNEIMRINQPIMNAQDYHISPISFEQDMISKRTHNTSHNHPDLVGTLDKCKFVLNQDAIDANCFDDTNVKILERDFFQEHIKDGIISPNQIITLVCELKYDGVSVEADCGLELISARSRGDTGIGAASDITPILQGYPFRHAGPMIGEEPLGVKFEAIMTRSNLEKFNIARGRTYVNCRSAIVGLFGASDAYKFRDYITLIPLAVDREQVPQIQNRIQEIEFINALFRSHGEPLRYTYFSGTVDQVLYYIKNFLTEVSFCRDFLNFMYDGIVISYLDEDIRKKLGRKNYINKYSMAVKFNPLEKQSMVRGITYEVGQHGQITPMIHYDPVEFFGTIHTKSTGSSLKRFKELDLRYGEYINIKYVNDVMPYVSKFNCDRNRANMMPKFEFIKECPVCGTPLITSTSGDTAICPNQECPARNIKRMVNMFAKLNTKGFAEASFNLINDKTHFYQLYENNEEYYISKLGDADGRAFYRSLMDLKFNKIKDYIFMGSIGFTSIAHKKWQSIFKDITLRELTQIYETSNSLEEYYSRLPMSINGDITKSTIANEYSFFYPDIKFVLDNNMIIDSKINGIQEIKKQIRFSGVRNLQLTELLSTKGYDIDDGSVTKKTDILIVPYDGFESGKVAKAKKQPETIIVSIDEFINNMEVYIGEKYNL